MPANRIFSPAFSPTAIVGSAPLLQCATPVGMVVMIAAPQQLVALQQRLLLMAQERARKALEPPRHYRLLANMN
jgi:hypothetical protein